MKIQHLPTMFGAVILAVLPTAASAHPGRLGHGLAAGLSHPFTGADHMLAMVAVGLWAALRGGKAIWAWPAAFVTAMLAGYGLGRTGVSLPAAEPAILASVILLGALTAADARVRTGVGVALIAVFGLAHGYAHGVEAVGDGLGFPAGMALSTIALHLTGLGCAIGLGRLGRPSLVRVLGVGAALGGVALAVAG